jgi:uncharacterized membrane protein
MAELVKEKEFTDSIAREIGYWALFSVVIALAQLWLIPVGYYLLTKPWTLVELIGNGSLLFFATTITSKTAGEYFKRVKGHHGWATLICLTAMIFIVFVSVFAFALEAAVRAGAMSPDALSPERVTGISLGLAFAGIVFSFAYTLYIRAYGA